MTADHCLTGNVGQFVFRFRYEAGNPLCPGQQPQNGNQGNWFVISGSQLRANNAATDFALLELNGNNHFHPQLAFAGWNRLNQTPSSTTIIHHPSGDAKKITFDFGPPQQQLMNGVECWFLQTDLGATEGGSSGGPYFGNDRRIIGQHYAIDQTALAICARTNRYGGRLDLSWTGGGTNTTRLSNWLAGTNPPTTTNTIRAAFISPFVSNNDFEVVCTTNKDFTLNNAVAGSTITWSVSNPHLFATSGGANTSGTGEIATLRAANSIVSGSAVITFTFSLPGCTPTTITRNIWVGKPGTPVTDPPLGSTTNLGTGQFHTVFLLNAPGAKPFTANWASFGSVSFMGGNPAPSGLFGGVYPGTGTWRAATSNICGLATTEGYYNVSSCAGCPFLLVNNPVQYELIVQIPEYSLPVELRDNSSNISGDFILLDQNGVLVKTEKFYGKQHITDVGNVGSGLYIARFKSKDFDLLEKVVIIK